MDDERRQLRMGPGGGTCLGALRGSEGLAAEFRLPTYVNRLDLLRRLEQRPDDPRVDKDEVKDKLQRIQQEAKKQEDATVK